LPDDLFFVPIDCYDSLSIHPCCLICSKIDSLSIHTAVGSKHLAGDVIGIRACKIDKGTDEPLGLWQILKPLSFGSAKTVGIKARKSVGNARFGDGDNGINLDVVGYFYLNLLSKPFFL